MAKRTKSARKAAKKSASVRPSSSAADCFFLRVSSLWGFYMGEKDLKNYLPLSFPQLSLSLSLAIIQFSPRGDFYAPFSLSLWNILNIHSLSSIYIYLNKQKPSAPRQRTPARKGYKVWTDPEKAALSAGVAKYGPGNFLFFFVNFF